MSSPFLRDALVLIPALNEETCLPSTIASWLELGARKVRVVDNGSTDNTAAVARSAGAEVLSELQRGYGAAAWRGLQDWPQDLDWVIFSSADGSDRLTPAELHQWNRAIEGGADLLVGDRVSPKESCLQLKWTQRFGNALVCHAIHCGWGQRFKDMGSLRAVRYGTLMDLNLADRGFGWNVEMQVRAIEHGLKIIELPVHYYPRTAGASKISGSLAGTFRAGKAMLSMLVFLWVLRRQTTADKASAAAPAISRGS